jgi:acid stress-induced BolA-like protein IbaG/YrbA
MRLGTLGGGSPISGQIQEAIARALPGAEVRVTAGQPGHFSVWVRAVQFRNQSRLSCQRLVYKAIAPLMTGERAPVHAIDQLQTDQLETGPE